MTRYLLTVLTVAALLAGAAPAQAAGRFGGPTVAILDAIDRYAQDEADYQGWTYVDRTDVRGGFRRATANLWFVGKLDGVECDRHGRHCHPTVATVDWKVEVVAERCAPGVFAVETPLGGDACAPTADDLAAAWREYPRRNR